MFDKKLPFEPIQSREELIHLELLSLIYQDSSIVPVSYTIEEDDGRDFLAQKYVDKAEHMMMKVKGEIVTPSIPLFDCSMFAFNYRKFYS